MLSENPVSLPDIKKFLKDDWLEWYSDQTIDVLAGLVKQPSSDANIRSHLPSWNGKSALGTFLRTAKASMLDRLRLSRAETPPRGIISIFAITEKSTSLVFP